MSESSGAQVAESAALWRSTALRLALATCPLAVTILAPIFPESRLVGLFVIGLFGLSLVQPRTGLLVITSVVFLGYPRQRVVPYSTHLDEAWPSLSAVLLFLAGWLLLPRSDRRGPFVPGAVAWLTAIAGACAIVGFSKPEWIRFETAITVVAGLGLMAATVTLFRWYPRLARDLPIAMVSSALAGAVASVLLTREMPTAHLAATLCVAIGMAASKTTRAGCERLLWGSAAAVNALAVSLAFLSGGDMPDSRNLASVGTDGWTRGATWLLALTAVATVLVMLRWCRAVARAPRDLRLVGCGLGVAVTTATWLLEPNRAMSEQAFPTWILAGLVAGLSGSTLMETTALPPTMAEAPADLRV